MTKKQTHSVLLGFSVLWLLFLAIGCKKDTSGYIVISETHPQDSLPVYYCKYKLSDRQIENFKPNYLIIQSSFNSLVQFESASVFRNISIYIMKSDSSNLFCQSTSADLYYCNFNNFKALFAPGNIPFFTIKDHFGSTANSFNVTLSPKIKIVYFDTTSANPVYYPMTESSGSFNIKEIYERNENTGKVIVIKGTFSCVMINHDNKTIELTDGQFTLPFIYKSHN